MNHSIARKLLDTIIHWPKTVIFIGLLLVAYIATALPTLEKDIRSDAFLAHDNPAIVYREAVKKVFGLTDPLVIALASEQTIYQADSLNLIASLSERLQAVDNINADSVRSIATENNISGSSDGLLVEPFYVAPVLDDQAAQQIEQLLNEFPLYQGILVSQDGRAALIAFEYLDPSLAADTYQTVTELMATYEAETDLRLHLAGEGAITGFVGEYIDQDAIRLYPITGSIILVVVFLAISRVTATLATLVLIVASVGITMGTMASMGIPYYVITNALPVILIGISVADSIHIYSEYFDRRRQHSAESIEASVVATLARMWRPITLTSLTTIAGFMALAYAAEMPPFIYFGYFTALGVAVAWLYSLIVLPALIVALKTEAPLKSVKQSSVALGKRVHDWNARLMSALGRISWDRSNWVISMVALISAVGVLAALDLKVDGRRIDTFHSTTDIYLANELINQVFNGTNNIDIVIEASETEGLLDPVALRKIEQLQDYVEGLPNVTASVSIVDYLKQMNKAMNEGQQSAYELPTEQDVVAQYLLLYSLSGGSSDFEQEIDYDYRLANLRITLNHGAFRSNRPVIESIQTYLAEQFNDETLQANISGRVYLYYHWMKDLSRSHFLGLSIALVAVWLVASAMFRSLVAGLYVVVPVIFSVLAVYAAMVFLSIPLGIASSMFAAIAIGLGVDFSIHTLERFRLLYSETQDLAAAFEQFYPSVGRALLFNLLAVACGFGILVTSQVVPLNNFGALVAISVITCFFTSLSFIPAMIKVFKPRFLIKA